MLHVGSIRTALFAYLFAKKHNGQFLLRIEDTDQKREVEGAIGHIMQSLKWLGIEWDEGPDIEGPHAPYIQSARLDIYKKYADRLVASGFAYPDPYTTEELTAFREAAEAEKRPFLFRDHRPEVMQEWDGSTPLRFRVPEIKRYSWFDAARGELSAGEEALDDIVLIKGDGYPTYNFAHVVDDIEMEITHVMRGEEFISSTPKFLSLYDAFELEPPVFVTMPPILGESGTKKLSKRDGAKDVFDYRDEGYLPEALVNFLALLGWNPGTEQEIFSMMELANAFDLAQIQRSGAQFDEEKLKFMNREWLRKLTDEEYLIQGGFEHVGDMRLIKAVPLMKERAHTLGEAREMLAGELSCLFEAPTLDHAQLVAKESATGQGSTVAHLLALIPLVEALHEDEDADIETVKTALMPYADAQEASAKGGRGAVLWPLRYALSGRERSPDPFTLIYILGKDEALMRIRAALAILG
jgi:glutamyl-tRNA synthetase